MIKELVEVLIADIKSALGSGINVIPVVSVSGDINSYATTPTLVLEGPEIEHQEYSFTREYDEIDDISEVKKYGVKSWWKHIDIVFRVRFFFTSLMNELSLLEKINCLANTINGIVYMNEKYDVNIDEDFRSDITPNFSDIKHSESLLRIENVRIRKDSYDEEAFELKKYILDFFEKGE